MMAKYGISEAAVVEQAVREYAERRGITIPATAASDTVYDHTPKPGKIVSE
jgi:hypothetical protein